MRILFISHTYVVGLNQGKLEAITNTSKAVVGLLVPKRWKARGWGKVFDLETPYPEIDVYPANVFLSGIGGGYFFNPWKLNQVIKKFKPDVIQVEQEVFSLCALEVSIIARLSKVPLAVFGWENQDRVLPPWRRWIRSFVLDTAQLMVAGNHDGMVLLRQWGYDREIVVMPQMGVDTSIFHPKSIGSPDRKEFVIGFIGRLIHRKGIDTLFDAVRLLKDKGYQFRLMLCGSGQDEAELKQVMEKLEISDVVNWKGKVPHAQVPQEMRNLDILVLPSRTMSDWKEQFGHVIIEAMSSGVPVVGSSCGEIPHIIDRSDLIFPEEDSQKLCDILERLICEPAWYEEVCQYGTNRVEQHYTHEKIAENLLECWEKLLNSQKPEQVKDESLTYSSLDN